MYPSDAWALPKVPPSQFSPIVHQGINMWRRVCWTSTIIPSFHSIARSPLFPLLGTINPCFMLHLSFTFSIHTLFVFVSIEKTILNSSLFTTFAKALTIQRFPSPYPYWLSKFLVPSGVALQLPSIHGVWFKVVWGVSPPPILFSSLYPQL